MNGILLAVIIVVAIGIIAGIGLSIASIVMAVPKDEKAEAIEEALPGANCGACGFSGCSGYAKALSEGKAEVGLCSPGGNEVAKKVAEILGTTATDMERQVANIMCNGNCNNTKNKMEYSGITSCAAAMMLHGGVGQCSYGCIGFGDCANVCDHNAIEICDGVAIIHPDDCGACKKCINACPKKLISLVPYKKQARVMCSNHDKGGDTRKVCSVGCIGCMKCVKTCEQGAIKIDKFKAVIDPSLCTGCGSCVEVCPVKAIHLIFD